MELPKGLYKLQEIRVSLYNIHRRLDSTHLYETELLIKEMYEALKTIQMLNENEFGWRDDQVSSLINPVMDKIENWK